MAKMYRVYSIIERPKQEDFWLNIGTAFPHEKMDQWSCQMFLRHASQRNAQPKMNLQQAIDAPAWHIEHFPLSFSPRTARTGVLVVEGRLPTATIKELERRGHKVEVGPNWSEGRLSAASQDGVRRKAAANARGMQGYAAGR